MTGLAIFGLVMLALTGPAIIIRLCARAPSEDDSMPGIGMPTGQPWPPRRRP